MDKDHGDAVKKLCRICGGKIVLRRGYVTAKTVETFQDILLKSCNVNIQNEPASIFPKQLCAGCVLKLQRLKKDERESGHTNKTLDCADFAPHSESCVICSTPTLSRADVKLAEIDKVMKELNFQRIIKSKEFPTDIFCIYTSSKVNLNGILLNELTFQVYKDYSWKLFVFNKDATSMLDIDKNLNTKTILSVKEYLMEHEICNGIDGYEDLIKHRLDYQPPFKGAVVETCEHERLNKHGDYKVVRSENCRFFKKHGKRACDSCLSLLPSLYVLKSRLSTNSGVRDEAVSASSHTNYRWLSHDEKTKRLANLQQEKRSLSQKFARWSAKIADQLERDGVILDDDQEKCFGEIMSKAESSPFDSDSPQHLLWEQQKVAASKSNAKGMRWHPLILRWCISIYYTSSAAYKQLSNRSLNFLQLPSIDTLRQYSNFTTPGCGFNPDVIKRLVEETNTDEEKDQQVVLLLDEMQIKSKLVYQKSTGKLVGFTELGSLNDEFKTFEASFEKNTDLNRDFATHVLVFMVRGIFTPLIYPFGYFGTMGATSAQLYPCTMEAIRVLSAIGLDVRAIVSDGASANRKFYKILAGNDFHFTTSPHSLRRMYLFADLPHLMKTTRNCAENSNWNKNTRNLFLDKQSISWRHFVDVYEEDLGVVSGTAEFQLRSNALGLRKLPKIKEEHIKLTSRSRMTVKLAVQVLSDSMANALKVQDRHDTKSTIKFVEMFDKAFDCLNVMRINQGPKKELAPYRELNDWRFQFLEEDFLNNFLLRWETQVVSQKNILPEDQKRMLLSIQTRNGWKMTVLSFVKLAKELLQIQGVSYLLSEKFTQDPLEEHFGRQRRKGGSNDNPTLQEFGQQELALNVMNSSLIRDIKGNTRGRKSEDIKIDVNDDRCLPKRRKTR